MLTQYGYLKKYFKDTDQEWIPAYAEFRENLRTGPLPGTWVRSTETIVFLIKGHLRKCSKCGIMCNRYCTARGITIHRECEEWIK